jgi:hypothetical protein
MLQSLPWRQCLVVNFSLAGKYRTVSCKALAYRSAYHRRLACYPQFRSCLQIPLHTFAGQVAWPASRTVDTQCQSRAPIQPVPLHGFGCGRWALSFSMSRLQDVDGGADSALMQENIISRNKTRRRAHAELQRQPGGERRDFAWRSQDLTQTRATEGWGRVLGSGERPAGPASVAGPQSRKLSNCVTALTLERLETSQLRRRICVVASFALTPPTGGPTAASCFTITFAVGQFCWRRQARGARESRASPSPRARRRPGPAPWARTVPHETDVEKSRCRVAVAVAAAVKGEGDGDGGEDARLPRLMQRGRASSCARYRVQRGGRCIEAARVLLPLREAGYL